LTESFGYISYAQQVIFGAGSLAQLGEAVERFGWQRLLLCTNHSMQAAGNVNAVKAALRKRLVEIFDRVQPHVQDIQVDEVLNLAAEREIDAVIGLGGGSPIGMAKAVASALEERYTSRPARAAFPTEQPFIPVIAIPTTYAGSEMTATYGIAHTREDPPRKITVSDPKIAAKLVIYDPRLTIDLPPEMTASTGINALAHCIEALYSITRHPMSTAAATEGIRHITNALVRCYVHGDDLDARTEMLQAAHLAGLSLASVSMGLHHGLCHVLGGSANVPHGIANSIVLSHGIRFNADVVAPQLIPAAQAMRISTNGTGPSVVMETLAQKVSDLVVEMNLPQCLRDVGTIQESDLPRLAQLASQNHTIQNNPKPISEGQLEALLRNAW
jgi:alcohol dehydrogenase class IV